MELLRLQGWGWGTPAAGHGVPGEGARAGATWLVSCLGDGGGGLNLITQLARCTQQCAAVPELEGRGREG